MEGEGEIVAAIAHPNIVRLLERGEHGGRLYLAMELLEGDTLAQRLTRGKLSERRALQMGAQIASALAALHAHGVIHRDVTSGNIMCLPDGRFVLLDFGLARGAARTTLTEAATMVGTLPYMAPEILRSEAVDEASDLWSLGVVLFEALVGHLPWGEGQPTLQMALAIARLDTSPEVLARAPLRAGVAELLAELLHPDARKRLRDAGAVAERLASAGTRRQRGQRRGRAARRLRVHCPLGRPPRVSDQNDREASGSGRRGLAPDPASRSPSRSRPRWNPRSTIDRTALRARSSSGSSAARTRLAISTSSWGRRSASLARSLRAMRCPIRATGARTPPGRVVEVASVTTSCSIPAEAKSRSIIAAEASASGGRRRTVASRFRLSCSRRVSIL